MIKTAAVNSLGIVQYVRTLVDDSGYYVDGTIEGSLTFHEISLDSNDLEVLATWYWEDGWKTRIASPGPNHDWDMATKTWVIVPPPPGPTASELKATANRKIIEQITEIEQTRQQRALRDFALLGQNTRLLEIDNEIKTLRSQLL